MSYIVDLRGHPACPCQVAWIPAFEHEAQRRGLLVGQLTIYQLIGGAPQSGGTHTDGGADDTAFVSNGLIWLSRQMGADATWHRRYNWDGDGGMDHVHRVLTGCIHNGPARYQIDAVRAGLNGLANHGPDDGPRPLSGRTWREGIAWAHQQEDDEMARYEEQLKTIEAKIDALAAREAKVDTADRVRLLKILGRLADLKAAGKATAADIDTLLAMAKEQP